jgi:hypothetical protein
MHNLFGAIYVLPSYMQMGEHCFNSDQYGQPTMGYLCASLAPLALPCWYLQLQYNPAH